MFRKVRIQKRVVRKENLFGRSIRADNMLKKADRFVVERRAQAVIEFGESLGINTTISIELIKTEPLPKELRRETARFWIVQHPAGLAGKLLGVAKLAGTGRPAQLVVGQRRPNQKAQPTG